MSDPLAELKCSHCFASGSIAEDVAAFFCTECGWWGVKPDQMIYDPEREGYEWNPTGQVARKNTD